MDNVSHKVGPLGQGWERGLGRRKEPQIRKRGSAISVMGGMQREKTEIHRPIHPQVPAPCSMSFLPGLLTRDAGQRSTLGQRSTDPSWMGENLGENREKRGKAGKWREQFLLQKLQIIVTCLSGLGGLWPSNPAWDTLSTQAEEHTTLFIRKRGCKPEVRREDIH